MPNHKRKRFNVHTLPKGNAAGMGRKMFVMQRMRRSNIHLENADIEMLINEDLVSKLCK
jgi:hypothetical protein